MDGGCSDRGKEGDDDRFGNNLSVKIEGKTRFILPDYADGSTNRIPTKSMSVFYNERMVFNRDLTVLACEAFGIRKGRNDTVFFDTMAASGVRALRVLSETNSVSEVYVCDLNGLALRCFLEGARINGIDPRCYLVFRGDAYTVMVDLGETARCGGDITPYTCGAIEILGGAASPVRYADIIDIDPFGSPSRYIIGAYMCIKSDGMLCITATDMPVLFGIKKRQSEKKYMGHIIRTEYIKEAGARLLIYYAMRIGHIFGFAPRPLITLSSDHYVRIFLEMERGFKAISRQIGLFGHYIHCKDCGYRNVIRFSGEHPADVLSTEGKCPICGGVPRRFGPIWTGRLHDPEFIEIISELLDSGRYSYMKGFNRLKKYIGVMAGEIGHPPYYYKVPHISDELNIPSPPLSAVIELLGKSGYGAVRTHFDPVSIKTEADISAVRRILKEAASRRKDNGDNKERPPAA